MRYNTILLDFDDTLVDFYDAEDKAFHNMAKFYNHYPTEKDFQFFKKVNQAHWEAFQKNELTKEEVLSHRFIEYFSHYGIEVDGKEADIRFRDELAKAPVKYFDLALETIDRLAQICDLYIVTNGVTDTQKRRIAQLDFKDVFAGVFISEETGYQKPMAEFFDHVYERIGKDKKEHSLIVGDSLTSDVLGGKNAGIATCWFNYRDKSNNSEIKPDYEIKNLSELVEIVEKEEA